LFETIAENILKLKSVQDAFKIFRTVEPPFLNPIVGAAAVPHPNSSSLKERQCAR
jgi:hypothetical protein